MIPRRIWVIGFGLVFILHSASAWASPAIVRVTGHGERKATPDLALIQFEIQSRAPNAQVAQSRSAEAYARIEKLLTQEYRIEKKDFQTVRIGVQPELDYSGKGKPKILGYLASHAFAVRHRAIAQTGKLTDSLLATGTSLASVLLNGISFSLEKPEAFEAETLTIAMSQARNRAEAIAQAAGQTLKSIRSVVQGGLESQPVLVSSAEATPFRAKSMTAPTQVAPGEIILSSDVTVEYEF